MALIQQRILKSINIKMSTGNQSLLPDGTIYVDKGAVESVWSDQIFDDIKKVVVAETAQHRAYTVDQKSDFLNDVPNAQNFVTILNW